MLPVAADYVLLASSERGGVFLEDEIVLTFNSPVDIQSVVLETLFEEEITVEYTVDDGPDVTNTVSTRCTMVLTSPTR